MVVAAMNHPVAAQDHNDLVNGLRGITYVMGHRSEAVLPLPHPWRTRVSAMEEPGKWRVTMLAGFVNDVEATVAYLTQDDPRGWTAPAGYPWVSGGVADRSWREVEDAPFLVVDEERDFTRVAHAARPGAFRTEEAMAKELLVASVFVSARLAGLIAGRMAVPRYRTWAGRFPSFAGRDVLGVREVARIYVLRDEEGVAEGHVQQREFYDLVAQGVEPVKLLPGAAHIPDVFGGFGLGLAAGGVAAFNASSDAILTIVNGALGNLQDQTSTVEWWSV